MSAVPSVSAVDARVRIVAITKHGAAQAAALARRLPQASICTSAKFAGAFAEVANPVRAYEGALRDEIAPLFEGFDQLVFLVSLGRGGAADRAAPEEQGRRPGRDGDRRCRPVRHSGALRPCRRRQRDGRAGGRAARGHRRW